MIITNAKIVRVLQDNKNSFDPAMDDGQVFDAMKKITEEILQAPVIQEAKWITFSKYCDSESGLTSIYHVRTKEFPHSLLGEVRWEGRFRSYAFYPCANTIYEPQCLNDIIHFIETLMYLKKEKKGNSVTK